MISALLLAVSTAMAFAAPSINEMPKAGVYINAEGSPLLPMLANATGTIDIEIYTMKSQTVRDLIRGALDRGVKVRVIMEPKPVGETCNIFGAPASSADAADCADLKKLMGEVRASGGAFEPYNKQALCPNGGGKGGSGCFEHGKIALADGIALVSTGNFDSTNLCLESENPSRCDRDYTLIDDSVDVFSTLTSIFEADLKGASYDVASLIPASLTNFLTVSPDALTPMIRFIGSAQQSIDLEAQYLKEPNLNNALIAAANRGVKVSVTVSSACAFGKPTSSAVNEITSVYSAFDQAGILSRMYNASNKINGHAGYMHAKVIVVDGVAAWLGSENGSTESLTQNREYGVVFGGASYVDPIFNTIKADRDDAASETWSESLQCLRDK